MRLRRPDGSPGSVTVILTLLLVPMVVVAGVFVDGGRGHLSRTVVRSAEQLALNDVLARHDAELSKMFGLLGVIEDESLAGSADQVLKAALDGGGGGNIIRVTVPGTAEVIPVSRANLGEPRVLNNQIVEFMKYRAPAGFIGELTESLTWLKTIKTNMELIRARVQYLNKVSDVLEEATDLFEDVEKVLGEIDSLVARINDAVTLLTGDPDVVDIYVDAFDVLARDLAGQEVTSSEKDRVSANLDRVVSTVTGLSDAATSFRNNVSELDPQPLLDAITALRGKPTSDLEAARDAHASAGGDDVAEDVNGTNAEISATETFVDAIEDAVTQLGAGVVEDVRSTVDDFVADIKQALRLELPDFASITSYSKLKSFGTDYLEEYLGEIDDATSPEAIDAAVAQIRSKIETRLGQFRDRVVDEVRALVRDQVQKAVQEIKELLADAIKDEVGESGFEILKKFFKLLAEKWEAYGDLFDDLAHQTAFEGAAGGSGTNAGESVGGSSDKDELADNSDEAIDGIIGLLGNIGQVLENVRDAAIITQYVVGEFTYSTVEHENPDGMRLTYEPFFDHCKDTTCAVEAEYILTGVNSAVGSYGLVFLVRLAVNMITAFRDPIVTAIRSAIAAVPIVGTALSFVVPVLAAVLQSVDDMVALHGGEKVPLYRAQLDVFTGTLGDLVDEALPDEFSPGGGAPGGGGGGPGSGPGGPSTGPSGPSGPSGPGGGGGKGKDGPELSYRNYLQIFLVVTTFVDTDGVVGRIGEIIEHNMAYAGRAGFALAQAHTAFTVTAEYRMTPLVSTFFSYDAGGSLFDGAAGRNRLTTVGGF